MATQVDKGNMTMTQALDQVAAGMTGTMAYGFGMALASGLLGIRLRGSQVPEDERGKGAQKYSIEIPWFNGEKKSFSLDWIGAPMIPMLMGATTYELMNSSEEHEGWSPLSYIAEIGHSILEPIMQMSVFAGISESAQSLKNSDGHADSVLFNLATSAAMNYLGQGIPSLLKQIDQATRPTATEAFINSPDPTARKWQQFLSGLPFIGGLKGTRAESVDAYGNTKDNWGERALSALIGPGNLQTIKDNPVADEIARLEEANPGESYRMPDAPKKVVYTDKDGNKVTHYFKADEYSAYEKERGTIASDLIEAAMESDYYKELDSEEQGQFLKDVYQYADAMAMRNAVPDKPYNRSSWEYNVDKDDPLSSIIDRRRQLASGLGKTTYEAAVAKGFDLTQMKQMDIVMQMSDIVFDAMHDSWKKGGYMHIGSTLDKVYSYYELMDDEQKEFFLEHNGSAFRYYAAAREAGVKTSTYLSLYRQYYTLDPDAKSSDNAEDWAQALRQAAEDGKITNDQGAVMQDAMKVWQVIPVEASTYNKFADAGVSARSARNFVEAIQALQPVNGNKGVSDWQKYYAIANKPAATDAEKENAIRAYMKSDSSTYSRMNAMLKAGYTIEQWADAFRIYSSAGSKAAQKKAAIEQAGYGTAVYNILAGK